MGLLKNLLLKYNFYFYIYKISTMRSSFILKTVYQISTLFDLGTTDWFSRNQRKKKNSHALIYHETKSLFLSYIRIFGTSIFLKEFLESMCHDTKDATENKVDFVSAVTQLSI